MTTSSCSLLLIYRPRKDERLSWPSWLTYSGRFTHISGHPSAVGRAQNSESSPVKDQRSTAEPRNQPNVSASQPCSYCTTAKAALKHSIHGKNKYNLNFTLLIRAKLPVRHRPRRFVHSRPNQHPYKTQKIIFIYPLFFVFVFFFPSLFYLFSEKSYINDVHLPM